jgi:UDP-2-acetamido-3-amino-2,3-dideoxy-glucuronate N-acetyltransferase
MKNIAIVGMGNWGKNLIYEFNKISNIMFCTSTGNSKNILWLKKYYPNIKYVQEFSNIVNNPLIDAIVIATPINSHYKLVKKSLECGKNVFVEKPLATNYKNAKNLYDLAKNNNVSLFVGHIFLYNQIFKKIQNIIKNEKIEFIKFDWNKTGLFSQNIFLDLVSHEFSLAINLFGLPITAKLLYSENLYSKNDLISIESKFKNQVKCLININRCSNFKRKSITIKSSKNIYLCEDNTMYRFSPKTLQFTNYFKTDKTPLEIECKEFVKNIKLAKKDFSNAKNAVNVINVLEKFGFLK